MNRYVASLVLVSSLSLAACADHRAAPTPSASVAEPVKPSQAPSPVEPAVARPDTTSGVTAAVAKTEAKPAAKVDAKHDAAGSAEARLSVKRLVVAKGVEKREPQGAATAFWKDDFDRLYAFVELDNPDQRPSKIVVGFVSPSGKTTRGNVTLAVGASPRWRTWAFSRAVDEKGTWSAVVSTEDGRELSREAFDIL